MVEHGCVSRRSSDPIELTEDERRELEAIAGRLTAPFRTVQRARIVLYAAEGLTNVEIAGRLDTAPEVVAKWRRRFRQERLDGLQDRAARGSPAPFSPRKQVAQVKAIACELPATHGVPLSRFSRAELHRLVIERGVTEASASTIGRWLAEDAIKPWQHRSWIFPRDPRFLEQAGPVLDLYAAPLGGPAAAPRRVSSSAPTRRPRSRRAARHPRRPSPAGPGRPQRVEHEYDRGGTLCYLAAWDVHHGRLFGRCEQQDRDRAVRPTRRAGHDQRALRLAPRRVFWIVDNGSSHRGQASIDRLQTEWPNLILVHLPVHASWLNQIEIFFSIIQRKVADPQRLRRASQAVVEPPRRLRAPLQPDRQAVRLELHPPRPRRPHRPRRRPRTATAARRMITTGLAAGTTKPGRRQRRVVDGCHRLRHLA